MKHHAPKTKFNLVIFLFILLVGSLITNIFLVARSYIKRYSSNVEKETQTVTKIIDGDTFDTKEGLRIRLAEINAPEYPKGCFSLQSKQRLEAFILGKEISIEEVTKDNFGRTVAYVFSADLLINKALVTEGYAKVSNESETKYSYELMVAETEAQSAKRGIWSALCQTQQNPDCSIKGNYRADNKTKLYHTLDCYNYDKISVNTDEKDQWFCNEEEAQIAGFTKSQDCP